MHSSREGTSFQSLLKRCVTLQMKDSVLGSLNVSFCLEHHPNASYPNHFAFFFFFPVLWRYVTRRLRLIVQQCHRGDIAQNVSLHSTVRSSWRPLGETSLLGLIIRKNCSVFLLTTAFFFFFYPHYGWFASRNGVLDCLCFGCWESESHFGAVRAIAPGLVYGCVWRSVSSWCPLLLLPYFPF